MLSAAEIAWRVYQEFDPYITAYLDEPKTLAELQENALDPQPGYDVHHIVERASAYQDGFPPELVEGPDNLVLIPTFKHWEVTGWFAKRNEIFRMQSPRDYLKTKTWSERRNLGLQALTFHGVLKP